MLTQTVNVHLVEIIKRSGRLQEGNQQLIRPLPASYLDRKWRLWGEIVSFCGRLVAAAVRSHRGLQMGDIRMRGEEQRNVCPTWSWLFKFWFKALMWCSHRLNYSAAINRLTFFHKGRGEVSPSPVFIGQIPEQVSQRGVWLYSKNTN